MICLAEGLLKFNNFAIGSFVVETMKVILFLLLFGVCGSVRIQLEHLPEACDFSRCAAVDHDKLNVHLVPHTHDDVGWLKTVDQYYYGSRQSIQKAGVQYILDSVIQALIRNPKRRFIYVETAFFAKWWREQDETSRAITRELVHSGQLEFINGGWCMNDEATTHYSSVIDQMTLGLKFLRQTFGPKCGVPRVAWHIDPFGHSREQANLFAQMNFDGFFFSRLDYQDHLNRRQKKTMEHVWRGSDDLGAASDLFVSIINKGYQPPDGFDWDLVDGKDAPVIDNPDSEEYNIDDIVNRFVRSSLDYSTNYATKHILFPMGEDFNYQSAHSWYKNLDKLITHVNEKQDKIRVFYSTPSCYLKALHDSNVTFETNRFDFLPYASRPDAFWTGFYTSRPTLKRMERVANGYLQAAKQIDVLADNRGHFEPQLRTLKEAMAVMQHHDAVAGTEQQHVANDYAKQLQNGLDLTKQLFTVSVDRLSPVNTDGPRYHCDLLNISACYASEHLDSFELAIYNPYSHPVVNHTVRLPVIDDVVHEVTDPDGQLVHSTLFPIPKWIQSIPGRQSNATYELVFHSNLVPLGVVTYGVRRVSRSTMSRKASKMDLKSGVEIPLQDMSALFDATGQLCQIVLGKLAVNFTNGFHYYKSYSGDNRVFWHQSSGAYVFRPASQTPTPIGKLTESVVYADARTGFYQVHQLYDSFVQQTIRLDRSKRVIEFDWLVQSIPIDDSIGKEIVVRYETSLHSNRTFFTDSNGRQVTKREWNHRPTWQYLPFEPISGNYYPVNSRLIVRDKSANVELSVLTDRSEGGTSPGSGIVELMLHRRVLHDDNFGVSEPLNETDSDGNGLVVRGTHHILLHSINQSVKLHRQLAMQLYLQPVITFANRGRMNKFARYSGLKSVLPENINILTLEHWNNNQVLLRLEHFFQSNEDSQLSKPASVNLSTLFATLSIDRVEELTLAANQPISARNDRLVFKHKAFVPNKPFRELRGMVVTLEPMQIRTFVLTLTH